jgi:hypothetical protein
MNPGHRIGSAGDFMLYRIRLEAIGSIRDGPFCDSQTNSWQRYEQRQYYERCSRRLGHSLLHVF